MHVLGLAVSVGILVMLDLRLVGAGMRHIPASDIMHKLKRWYLAGFVAMFVSGASAVLVRGGKVLSQPDIPHQADFPGAGRTERFIFRDQICADDEELGRQRHHAIGRAAGGLGFVDLLARRSGIRTLDRLRDEVAV